MRKMYNTAKGTAVIETNATSIDIFTIYTLNINIRIIV